MEAGVTTTLLTTFGPTSADGYPVKVSVTGNTFTAYYDPGTGLEQQGSTVDDSTYSTGVPGIAWSTNTTANSAIWDDFIATGETGGGAASFVPGIINMPLRGGGVRWFIQLGAQ
jgi:hypothetical protein